jgi:DNA-binding NarL/FixJ family response regulator
MLVTMSTSILIVDDHDIVRLGVRMLLAKDLRWDVCGEATDGAQAIEAVRSLHPDVVILDLTMPVMNGFAAAEEIRRVAPYTKIVFFSIHQTPSTARLVGANAFVHKGSAVEDLPKTLELIA